MPTINQLVRGKKRKRKSHQRTGRAPALGGRPQVRGAVLRVFVRDPRKPNSANRLCCRVRLVNGNEVTAFIPGKGHNIQEHATVLVRGGRSPDIGLRYEVIRGVLDASGVEQSSADSDELRNQGRSKYGTKRRKPARR